MTAKENSDDERYRCDGGYVPTVRIMKLRALDETTFGVTLPKHDLRSDGLVDGGDELTDEWQVVVRHVGRGKWEVETAKQIED